MYHRPKVADDFKSHWEPWIPRKKHKWSTCWAKSKRRGAAPFYLVERGRVPGLFYKWSDCLRSVAGLDDSVFCAIDDYDDSAIDDCDGSDGDNVDDDVDDEWGCPLPPVY